MECKVPSIAAVVVTYNRAELLIRCLNALVRQNLLPNKIFIIDNHSDDNTYDRLLEDNFISQEPNSRNEFGQIWETTYCKCKNPIKVTYLFKDKNDGGAGGFYAGMKMAYDAGYEWLWLMDDDGKPDSNQLFELYRVSNIFDLKYTNALVVNEVNNDELAFSLSRGEEISNYRMHDVFYDEINPFNGTFINRKVIDFVGFIKRELFIWGDETEYTLRVKDHGFKIGTICSALHYHPAKHPKLRNILPFVNWKKYSPHKSIYYRNYGYINWIYSKSDFLKSLITYTLAFGLRFQFRQLFNYYKYTLRGIFQNWTHIDMKK